MSSIKIGDAIASLLRDGMPVRFTAYDGSEVGPRDADIHLELRGERGLSYILTAPGDLDHLGIHTCGDERFPHRGGTQLGERIV